MLIVIEYRERFIEIEIELEDTIVPLSVDDQKEIRRSITEANGVCQKSQRVEVG